MCGMSNSIISDQTALSKSPIKARKNVVNYGYKKRFCLISLRQTCKCYAGLQIYCDPGPIISKYGPSLSKAVGPVDPSFLVVKKSHFDKNIHLQRV